VFHMSPPEAQRIGKVPDISQWQKLAFKMRAVRLCTGFTVPRRLASWCWLRSALHAAVIRRVAVLEKAPDSICDPPVHCSAALLCTALRRTLGPSRSSTSRPITICSCVCGRRLDLHWLPR